MLSEKGKCRTFIHIKKGFYLKKTKNIIYRQKHLYKDNKEKQENYNRSLE